MSTSPEFAESQNTYVTDAESAAEMARLLDQDKLITEAMDGLFSERHDLSGIYDVLDLACGPGGWVHEVAHSYPEMEVTGIDISARMVEYARAHARVRRLDNAHFRVMNVLKPLDFPDGSFDLVNNLWQGVPRIHARGGIATCRVLHPCSFFLLLTVLHVCATMHL